MKKIKNLKVTITHTVNLNEVVVSDKEYNALKNCFESWTNINCTGNNDESVVEAFDWLSDNINIKSTRNLKYEIDNLEEEK